MINRERFGAKPGERTFLQGGGYTVGYFGTGQGLPGALHGFSKELAYQAAGIRRPGMVQYAYEKALPYSGKQTLLQVAETGKVDLFKAFSQASAVHENTVEVTRAKVVTSTMIPVDPRYNRAAMPQLDPDKGPIHGIDPDMTGYYHLETDASGRHTIHLNEHFAGQLVTDMDGDQLEVIVRKDSRGRIIGVELLKEPQTQRKPRFMPVEDVVPGFHKSMLYEDLAGFSTGSDIIDMMRDPKVAAELTRRKIQVGTPDAIDAIERSLGRRTLYGELSRIAAKGGFDRSPEAVRRVAGEIAQRQLMDPMVGMRENRINMKIMHDTLTNLEVIKQTDPQAYAKKLLQMQKQVQAHLDVLRSNGQFNGVLGAEVLGLQGRMGDLFQGNWEDYLQSGLTDILDSEGRYNSTLERLVTMSEIAKNIRTYENSGQAAYEVEVGALKIARKDIVQTARASIIEQFQYNLVNSEFLFKTNRITKLGEQAHNDLIRSLTGDGGADRIQQLFGPTSLDQFEVEDVAKRLARGRERKVDFRFRKQGTTTLERMIAAGRVSEHSGFGIAPPASMIGKPNNTGPTAYMFYDAQGNYVGPREGNRASASIIGNVGYVNDQGQIVLANKSNMLGSLADDALGLEGRGYGELTGDMSYKRLLGVLKGEVVDKKGIRAAIMQARGIEIGGNRDLHQASLELADVLMAQGEGGAEHLKIAFAYDDVARPGVARRYNETLQRVISDNYGRNYVPVGVENGRIDVSRANLIAATNNSIDTRLENPELDSQVQIALLAHDAGLGTAGKIGGNARFINLAPVYGVDEALYVSDQLRRRNVDIRKQLVGGAILDNMRIAYAGTELSPEARRLFDLYDLDAAIGPKRPNEGRILASRSAYDKMVDALVDQHSPIKRISERDFDMEAARYVGRMLPGDADSDTVARVLSEFTGMFEDDGKGFRVLKEGHFKSFVSSHLKVTSMHGYKAVTPVADEIMGSMGAFDFLITQEHSSARGDDVASMQRVLKSAVRSGYIDPSDAMYSGLLERSTGPGAVNGWELSQLTGDADQLERLTRAMDGLLEDASVTIDGKKINFGKVLREDFANHMGVAGVFNDIIGDLGESSMTTRSVSKIKTLGSLMHAFEGDVGGVAAGAGAQVMLHMLGNYFEHLGRNVVGDVIDAAQGGSGQRSVQSVLEGSLESLAKGYGRAAGATEVTAAQLGVDLGSASPTTAPARRLIEPIQTPSAADAVRRVAGGVDAGGLAVGGAALMVGGVMVAHRKDDPYGRRL